MSVPSSFQPVTAALRVAFPASPTTLAQQTSAPWTPGRALRRPDVLLLAVDVDQAQELRVARWRRLRFGRTIHEGLVLPDHATRETVADVEAWARAHPTRARGGRGAARLSVDRLSVWAEDVLRPAITASKAPNGRPVGGRAWLVTWDVPWTMSRLCRSWGPATGAFYGGWSLGMFDAPDAAGQGTGFPRLRIRQLRDGVALARWSGTPTNARGERPRRLPPVIDLRHLTNALAGAGIESLQDACIEFEVLGGGARDA